MKYERYYDSENYCLKTEIIAPKQLTDRLVGGTEHSSPIINRTEFFHGFIDRSCFPEDANVSYLVGRTGPETKVTSHRVAPHGGTFEIKP